MLKTIYLFIMNFNCIKYELIINTKFFIKYLKIIIRNAALLIFKYLK